MKTDELLCNYIWLCLEEYRLSPRYSTAKRLRRRGMKTDELKKLVEDRDRILADIADFDGDRRGHYMAKAWTINLEK
jgi:hypothetical protein